MRTTSALPRWGRQRPRYRVLLVVILVAFTVLAAWNLARGGDAAFYAASARSMSESWRALLFGAFDPAATVTLDKLSGFAVPQAAAIAVFGMSTSSLALPQVIEGLVTVWAVSVIGLRWRGPRAGVLAAAAAASTPIFVSMFGHPMEDGLLTMALAVAVVWWQRALLTARVWPLLVAGVFIGVGFQAKMMQAWFILPALVVATLVGLPSWRGRLRGAGVLTASAVAASLAWITAIALVPAGSRPYIDGSTDDNVFAMVFGYNGIDRLLPGAVPDAVGSTGGHHSGSLVSALLVPASVPPDASPLKLLLAPYASQVGWLYPAATAGAVLALVRWWPRRGRGDRVRFAVTIAFVVWLATATVVLSLAHVPHTAYVAAIGVQLAVLAAVGWAELVRRARTSRPPDRFLLAIVLVAQTAWAGWLAVHAREPLVLAVPAAVAGVAAVAAATVLGVRRRPGASPRDRMPRPARARPLAGALVAVTAIGVIAGPAAFSAQVIDDTRDGSGGDASVGVRLTGSQHAADSDFRPSPPSVWGGMASLSPTDAALVAAASDLTGDHGALFLTDTTTLAADVISVTGRSVLTDGGYSGAVRVFTTDAIRGLIADGDVRALVVRRGAPETDPVAQVASSSSCARVRDFGEAPGPDDAGHEDAYTLYACR